MFDSSDDEGSTGQITCLNCNSSNFYRDEKSDSLICSECYTQCISQSQRETVEEEDVFKLAGRSAGRGRMISSNAMGKKARKRYSVDGRSLWFEDKDKSVPLPTLMECCRAFQILLNLAADRALILSGLIRETSDDYDDDEHDADSEHNNQHTLRLAMKNTVRDIWFKYIQAWSDAANYYGDMFPEARFSFRDLFLTKTIRKRLYRFLSIKVIDRLERDEEQEQNENKNNEKKKRTRSQYEGDILSSNSTDMIHKRSINHKHSLYSTESKDDIVNNDFDDSFQYNFNKNERSSENDSNENSNDESDYELPSSRNRNLSSKPSGTHQPALRKPIVLLEDVISHIENQQYVEMYKTLKMYKAKESFILTNHYAALNLEPNTKLLSSIIYLALLQLQTGISSNHIIQWSSNGSFPYMLSAFHHLPSELKNIIDPIKEQSFVLKSVPLPVELDYTVDLLMVACGYDHDFIQDTDTPANASVSTKCKRRGRPVQKNESVKDSSSSIQDSSPPDNIDCDNIVTENDLNSKLEQCSKNCLFQNNIPFMTCRFVTDLGLDQRVLDISLALMGLFLPTHRYKTKIMNSAKKSGIKDMNILCSTANMDNWLPAPLNGASPSKLVSPLHILAVIVVACRLCPGWENWKVMLSPSVMFENKKSKDEKVKEKKKMGYGGDGSDSDDFIYSYDVDSEDSEQKKLKKRQSLTNQRFIPWREEHMNLLGNGYMVNNYFDFLDECYPDVKTLKMYKDFSKSLVDFYKESNDRDEAVGAGDDDAMSSNNVVPNRILAGGLDHYTNREKRMTEKGPDLFWFLAAKHRDAIQSESNGIGEYVIYKKLKSRGQTDHPTASEQPVLTPEPFHPHYGLLIEYIADKVCAEPGELHHLVSSLDEEMNKYSRPELDWSCLRSIKREGKEVGDEEYKKRWNHIRTLRMARKCVDSR